MHNKCGSGGTVGVHLTDINWLESPAKLISSQILLHTYEPIEHLSPYAKVSFLKQKKEDLLHLIQSHLDHYLLTDETQERTR